MKSFKLLAFAIIVSVLGSCSKAPTPDPDLGEFQLLSAGIDMSQKNKFNESLICNKEWVLSSVKLERYLNGVLQESKNTGVPEARYYFRNDHTVRFFDGVPDGTWLYSHNYLMWVRYGATHYWYEVISVSADALQVREEEVYMASNRTPYFKDNSGSHSFIVYDYHAE